MPGHPELNGIYRGRVSRLPGVPGGWMIGILAPICGGSMVMPGSMLDGGWITSRWSSVGAKAINGPAAAAAC